MKKGLTWLFLFSILLAIILVSILPGCSSQPASPTATQPAAPSATATQAKAESPTPTQTIRIGMMGGQTGPASAPVVTMFKEIDDIFRYVNEVQGGIDGVKLDWKTVDNKGTPDGAVLAYKDLRDSYNPQIYMVIEDYYYSGIKDMIDQDKSVIFSTSTIAPQLYSPPDRFFTLSIPTADGFAGYVKWVKQNWKGSGQPNIGVLYWDLASGEMWKSAMPWVSKQGATLTPVQYGMTSPDYTAQLMKLRDSNVNYIWMMGTTQNAAVAIRGMNSLGLKDKIPLTFNEYVEADVLLGLVGKDGEGYTILRSESPYSDNTQAAQLYSKIYQWAEKKDKWSDNRLSINFLAAVTAAIKQAKSDVGVGKIDNLAIYNALNKLTSIDTWGNSQGFGYGPDRRIGVQAMKISKLTQTGTVSASDYITLPRTFEGIDK